MKTWREVTAGMVQRFDVAAAIGGNAVWSAKGSKACASIIVEMARIIDDEINRRDALQPKEPKDADIT